MERINTKKIIEAKGLYKGDLWHIPWPLDYTIIKLPCHQSDNLSAIIRSDTSSITEEAAKKNGINCKILIKLVSISEKGINKIILYISKDNSI